MITYLWYEIVTISTTVIGFKELGNIMRGPQFRLNFWSIFYRAINKSWNIGFAFIFSSCRCYKGHLRTGGDMAGSSGWDDWWLGGWFFLMKSSIFLGGELPWSLRLCQVFSVSWGAGCYTSERWCLCSRPLDSGWPSDGLSMGWFILLYTLGTCMSVVFQGFDAVW